MIADPNTDGRLLLALDDYINPKTGKKILAVPMSLIMPPNRISPNSPGRKISLPWDY